MPKATKASISPRKTPKQQRSKSLTEAILEASTRILSTLGYDAATTNRVAEMAGVSIGSLYQYFPNRDALIAGVIERHLKKQKEAFEQVIASHDGEPAELVIDHIVSDMVDQFLQKRALIKSFFVHLPRLEKTREVLMLRNQAVDILVDFIHKQKSVTTKSEDVRLSFYILVNAFVGVVHTYALTDDPPLTPNQLKRELARLSKLYLL